MPLNKELIKGNTVLLVLTLLNRKEMYGYEMIKEIELKSEGVFNFKEGTLYPILHTLEQNGAIESYWSDNEGKRKRKYYTITKSGKKALKEKQEEWKVFKSAIDKVTLEGSI